MGSATRRIHNRGIQTQQLMSQRALSPTTYVIVLIILVALTLLTVGISFVPLESHWHVGSGLVIALLKASLVVLFFMHALYSVRLTWIVIMVAVFWLVILFVLTFCDYLTRGMVPFMPGH